jgi:predicted esterase
LAEAPVVTCPPKPASTSNRDRKPRLTRARIAEILRACSRSLAAALVLHLAFAAAATAAPDSPETTLLRYALRPGDRLVYRERLERSSRGGRGDSTMQAAWTTTVLVLGGSPAAFVVGFERRRESAEMVRASGDHAKEDRAAFQERLARRPVVTAEANVFDERGRRLDPVRVDREWPGELLPAVQEIESLPEPPVSVGSEWKGSGLLGLAFRAEAWEDVAGERSLRAQGRSPDGRVVVRLWFSPALGALARLELDGRYTLLGQEIQERLSFELKERRRDEPIASWLGAPDERQAALEGLLLTDALPVPFPRVEELLSDAEAGVRRRALTLLWQRHRPPPPRESLAALLVDDDPRIRVLAVRMLEQSPVAAARGFLETALGDADSFVRDAALAWLRRRLTAERAVALRTPADAPWDALLEAPRPAGPLAPIVAAVRGGSDGADWRCEEEPDWTDRALLEQRASPQPPGVSLRAMTTGEFRGRPYVLRIPEDYRGDEPFPLLIHLAGGPGHALLGWSSAAEALLGTGYVVVAPHAAETWWSAESERLFAALLDETLASLNIDTSRVFLAGFSNGGTGAFRFATLFSDRLAAAVSLEGGGIFVHDGKPPLPAGVGGLPMLFVHGDRDDVIYPSLSTDTVAALKRALPGAAVELRILPGRGHDVVLGRDEGLTLGFIARHRRDPFPREVVFETDDLRSPRRYWIEVLEKRGGRARVEGRLADDGAIELRTRNVLRLRLLLRRELILPDKPVLIRLDGRDVATGLARTDCALLQRSWREGRDAFRAWSAEIVLTPGR